MFVCVLLLCPVVCIAACPVCFVITHITSVYGSFVNVSNFVLFFFCSNSFLITHTYLSIELLCRRGYYISLENNEYQV